tara:strand:- start:141 stop:482 length:342 start_codon:yes stop_codon:yes gene_type:complete
MTLYNIFYKGDSNGNPPYYETTTDNFDKWLEEHNAQRIEEGNEREDADDFEVEPISLSLYDDKIKSFKIYDDAVTLGTDDENEHRVLIGNDLDTALEILENNGYIVEVEYENG